MIKKIYSRLGFLLLILLITCCAWSDTLKAQDRLWGMTSGGGTNGQGTIFSMNPDGTGLNVNYSFGTVGTGIQPNGSLILNNNLLYGVTKYGGGANNQGVIFSFDTTTGQYTELYDFDGTNGGNPYEGLSVGPDGNVLYGVTFSGGANYDGVIFSFDPSTATYQKLYDMTAATGYNSYGPLTLYHDKFYGLTHYGGTNGAGTFFSFDPETNTYTNIYSYTSYSWDNYQSPGRMVVYNDVLYGVCTGGNSGYGQLFSYDDGGGGYKVLNDFTSGSLFEPSGIVLDNDMIYGVTYEDQNYYSGGVFSFDPNSGAYNELMTFGSSNAYPSYGNIMVYNDNLLGIGNSDIYQVTPDGTYTDLQDFTSVQPPLGGYSNYGTLLLPENDAPATGTTPQTISGMSDLSKNYGDTSFNPGAVASSGLKITYASTDKNVARVSGSKIRIAGAGTCQVIATQKGDTTYARVDDTVTLTVAKIPLLITADNKTVNQLQPMPVLTAHYTGFVNGDTTSSLTTQPVISSTGDPFSSPQGTYDLIVSGAVSPNYDISYQTGVLTIIGQLQVLQLVDSAVRNYGDPDFKLVFASNSGLPVTYSIDSADIATVSTSDTTQVHITGTGLTRVIARQSGNATWAPNYDTVLLQINKAPLTIVINDTSIVYGQPVPVFTCSYNGFVYNENASSAFSFGPVLTATSQETPPYPGIYQIQIADAVIRNYAYTYIGGIFTVNPSGDSLNAYCSSPGLLEVNIMSAAARSAALNLYSLGGQRVLSSDLSMQKGLNQFSFPVSRLSVGVYIVSVKGETFKLSQKVALFH
jgi:uncharacterized repeat protein (TIGR03803 family)